MSKLLVPLQFWFNKNPNCSLPIITLNYHDVKLEFEKLDNFNKDIANEVNHDELENNKHIISPECSCIECQNIRWGIEI